MEIVSVNFEDKMILEIEGVKISIHPFKEGDPNIVKLGVDAPKSVLVNREEVHHAKKRLEALSSNERVIGKVKSYNVGNGFGFATVKHTDGDVLIRHTSFARRRDAYNVWDGDNVSMILNKTKDGLVAEDVKLVE